MMKIKLCSCLLMSLFLSIASCSIPEPVRRPPDYISGKQLAETYAKRDAMTSCSHKRGNVLAHVIQRHLDAMVFEKSEDFKSGFSDGYRLYYPQFADTYCLN